jgi:hypothetical protein
MEPNFVPIHEKSIASMLQKIINETNLVNIADFLLEKYKLFYVYQSERKRYSFEKGIEVDIDVKKISKLKHLKMLEFVFKHQDILMKPFTLILKHTRHGDEQDILMCQKTYEENKKIVEKYIKNTCFKKYTLPF